MLERVLHQLGDDHDESGGPVGIQHAQITLAGDPDRGVHRGDIVHDRHDPVDHLVEVDLLVDRHRERVVHQRDRGHPPHRFDQRLAPLGIVGPARLQSQQRRDGLQIVLHPVVDLADGGVLGQQRAVAALDLGDIADEHRGPGGLPTGEQRDGAQQHRCAAGIQFHPGAGSARHRDAQMVGQFLSLEWVRHQRPGHPDEVVPLQLGVQTHPVIGRERVGAGEGHIAVDVQTDESITHAGAGPRHRGVADIGEGALAEHPDQVPRAVQIGLFQRAGRAPVGKGGLMGQHGDHPVTVANRHRLDVQPATVTGFRAPGIAFPADRPRGEGSAHDRHVGGVGQGSHRVGQQDRRCGVGADLSDTDQDIVIAAHPHQVVGEGQIGQQLPFPHHGVQVVDGIARQDSVLGEQITEGRHEPGRLRAS